MNVGKLFNQVKRWFRAKPAPAVVQARMRAQAQRAIGKMLRASDLRTPYGPNDPTLTAVQLALAQPLWNGPKLSAVQDGARKIEARFDNAQYDEGMRKHWAMADYLGPDAAANPGVRYLLRIRSRYEVANNSYARGIVTTIANDTIGTGPRLQMSGPAAAEVEDRFSDWSEAVRLGRKLRTQCLVNLPFLFLGQRLNQC